MAEILLPRFREVNFVFPGDVPMHVEGFPEVSPEDSSLSLIIRQRRANPGEYFCIASGIQDMATFGSLLAARVAYIEPEIRMYGRSEDIFLGKLYKDELWAVYQGSGFKIGAD